MKLYEKFIHLISVDAFTAYLNSLKQLLLDNKFSKKILKYLNVKILPYFRSFPKKIVIFSFLPSGILFLYLSIFSAPKYISEMSIALNNNQSAGGMFAGAQGLFPTGLGGDSNIAKLKLFLESMEATSRTSSILSLEEIYTQGDIFHNLMFSTSIDGIHKIRLSNLQINIDDNSDALLIKSKAFNPIDAFNLNMSIIVIINHYLNRNTRLANEIIETNKICELQSLRFDLSNDFSLESDNAKDLIISNELLSGSELILELTQKRRIDCLEEPNPLIINNNMPNLTSDMLFSAYETALKSITSNRLEKWNNKDSLEIIAEPNIPSNESNSNSIIMSLGLLIVTMLVIYTSTILNRIFKEFEI
jgi:capsule polysaccharide export protein KpsE/RkpR